MKPRMEKEQESNCINYLQFYKSLIYCSYFISNIPLMTLAKQLKVQELLFRTNGWKNWTDKRHAIYKELLELLK